jgi:hypothetical protein
MSPFSITPNSSIGTPPGVGEGSAEAVTLTLARRPRKMDEFFGGGVDIAEVRLEMRGILVGVSLEIVFNKDGGSLAPSFDVCEMLVPTEGDPAIVGSWFRVRKEASDCFCIELIVWEVSLEDDEEREVLGTTAGVDIEEETFKLATR